MQTLNWDDLRTCSVLARTGTLSAAARALDVQPSTVGRRLEALEATLGARLFDRTPDGYRLTHAGHMVVTTADPFAQRVTALERALAGADAVPGGVVRLTVGDAFFVAMLAPHLRDLRLRHPQITLDVITDNAQVDLSRREADLAIRVSSRPRQPNLVVRHLGRDQCELFASPEYLALRGAPGPGSSMRGHDVVFYSGEIARTPGARWLETCASGAFRAAIVSSVLAAVALAQAGMGLVVLPIGVARFYGGLEPVLSKLKAYRDVWLVWHEDLRTSARVRVVADYLTEVVQRGLAGAAPVARGV